MGYRQTKIVVSDSNAYDAVHCGPERNVSFMAYNGNLNYQRELERKYVASKLGPKSNWWFPNEGIFLKGLFSRFSIQVCPHIYSLRSN